LSAQPLLAGRKPDGKGLLKLFFTFIDAGMDRAKASRRALKWAIDRAGGERELADAISTTTQHVRFWLTKANKGVGAEYVLPIERATGISRNSLRPDLYPREDAA
jgi:DNA-binding transcriptional regulator YdaS (Cro superfamily)